MAKNKEKKELQQTAEEEIEQAAEAEKETETEEIDVQKLLSQAEAQRDEYLDALLRERASFENFKRRNESAVSKARIDAKLDTAAGFLPVLDNLERALTAATEDSPLKEGIEKVYKQLITLFSDMGVEEIPDEGEQFDPNLHNAVMQVEPEGEEQSGTIKTVLQKGYRTKDQVLRHSLVMVVK